YDIRVPRTCCASWSRARPGLRSRARQGTWSRSRNGRSAQRARSAMDRLDAIFFDIDDTLYSTSEFAKLARLNSIHAMIQHGLRMTAVDAFRELQEVIREFGSNYGDHYQKLLLRLPPESYAGLNPAILIAAGVGAYHKTKFESLRPYDDVMEVFAALKEKTTL